MAYPANLLPADKWRAITANLENHFLVTTPAQILKSLLELRNIWFNMRRKMVR